MVAVVAETVTRGVFHVRIERVGRPEVKNMMLGPKQFDPVNRDLEIRDLYNSEDAFNLQDDYVGAYRARLDANLAFWDGLDGKADWPPGEGGRHPLTELVLADYLVVDVTKPYVEQGSYPGDRARGTAGRCPRDVRRTDAQRRRDGHDVHAAHQRRQRAGDPRRRRPVVAAGHPRVPVPGRAQPGPARAARAPLSDGARPAMTATEGISLELDDIQSGALHERPSPYVGTYLLLRIDDRAAGRELVRRLHDARRLRTAVRRSGPTTPGSPWPSPTTGLEALGVPQASLDSFAPEFREGMAARAAELGDVGESSPEHWETAARHRRRPRRPGGALPRRRAAAGRRREGAPRPQSWPASS